jgi:hypothetical protein
MFSPVPSVCELLSLVYRSAYSKLFKLIIASWLYVVFFNRCDLDLVATMLLIKYGLQNLSDECYGYVAPAAGNHR